MAARILRRKAADKPTHAWRKDFKQNRALYFFVLPAVIEVLIFNYLPMYGAQIAFRNFKPAKGIWGSDWAGLKWFERFFNSFQAQTVISNTILVEYIFALVLFPNFHFFCIAGESVQECAFKKIYSNGFIRPALYFHSGDVWHDYALFESIAGIVWGIVPCVEHYTRQSHG